MAYTGVTIKDLDVTAPNGASENVSILDDSDKEIKTVLKNQYAITTITGNTNLAATHSVIVFGATCNAVLPTASAVASSAFTKQYHFINPVGSGFTGTIVGTVSGISNPTLAAGQTAIVYTDGTSWFLNAPKYIGADGALRTASATPAANSVAVRDADGFLQSPDLFDRFISEYNFEALDGYDVSLGAGSRTVTLVSAGVVQLSTGITISSRATIQDLSSGQGRWNITSGSRMQAEFYFSLTSIADNTAHLRFQSLLADPPSDTDRHVGFKIINGRVWAVSSNTGTTAMTDTGVDLVGSVYTRLRFDYKSGTNIRFYVNGVLKATHTTDLPTGCGHLGANIANTIGLEKRLNLHRVLLVGDY